MSGSDEDDPIPVIGYSDRLSVQPGAVVRFMVSSDLPKYRADIVRLVHAAEDPRGPGFKEQLVQTPVSREYAGVKKRYPKGSYIVVPPDPVFGKVASFTLQAWIFPTTPKRGLQGLITSWIKSGGPGYGLFLGEDGGLAAAVRDAEGREEWVRGGRPLLASHWYFVAASYDAETGRIALIQEPAYPWALADDEGSTSMVERTIDVGPIGSARNPVLIGGFSTMISSGDDVATDGHYNGKIDSPRLFSRALERHEIASLRDGASPRAFETCLVGAWDLSRDASTTRVVDDSSHGLDGRAVNSPKMAVTGHNWTGREVNYRLAPGEYGAIHFHEDDLDDSSWDVDFELRVPADLKSGVYAARLQAGRHKDYVPFFVRPAKGTSHADIAFLAPTLTYLAYANDHILEDPELRASINTSPDRQYPSEPIERYVVKHNLLSLYDHHKDGSGVCYASSRRPLLCMRPEFKLSWLASGKGSPAHLGADLCLLDWMEQKGFQYDVLTDEDLHSEGMDLLTPYAVVVTGTHPEYWTEKMLEGMESYLRGGGRLMYMGGNGFYWVTSIDPERPHIIEVRRWGGTQAWRSEPGEYYHSSTGEMGGLWRNRNRAPQKMVGVGFTSEGFDHNVPYRRLPDSTGPEAAFIFEGIGLDESIGDFDCLIQDSGAAGYEVDRYDLSLGTPPHALRLATATGFTDAYQFVVEEVNTSDSKQGGTVNPLVRADMVYFKCPPNGGGVFSTGSIAWCGCLSYNGYDNNVSRITENVLRKFSSSERL